MLFNTMLASFFLLATPTVLAVPVVLFNSPPLPTSGRSLFNGLARLPGQSTLPTGQLLAAECDTNPQSPSYQDVNALLSKLASVEGGEELKLLPGTCTTAAENLSASFIICTKSDGPGLNVTAKDFQTAIGDLLATNPGSLNCPTGTDSKDVVGGIINIHAGGNKESKVIGEAFFDFAVGAKPVGKYRIGKFQMSNYRVLAGARR